MRNGYLGEPVSLQSYAALLQSIGETYTFQVNKHLSLALSKTPWPNNLKTAGLQKGLVLVLDGVELIQEGLGFGAPVAVYNERIYFSSSSTVRQISEQSDRVVLQKTFIMDSISRKYLNSGRFNLPLTPVYDALSSLIEHLEKLYRLNRGIRRIMMGNMRLQAFLGIEKRYEKVARKGEVSIIYEISPELLRITAELGALDEGWQKVCLLNELGSSYFRKYFDSDGRQLYDDEIGAWEKVAAEWAGFSDLKGHLSFVLKSVGKAELFRGREALEGLLAWTGLTYEVRSGNVSFGYDITLAMK